MGYIEDVVTRQEKILAIYHLSGFALWLAPIFLCLVAFATYLFKDDFADNQILEVTIEIWPFVLAFAVFEALRSLIRLITIHMGLTDHRLIYKEGLIRRESDEIRLQKVETVDIDQSVIGRLFDYGTLEITGTGGSRVRLLDIDQPLRNKRFIDEAVLAAKRH